MGAYRRGFNEARARTPRKVAQDRTGHMCSPGFNEAGARTPRKVAQDRTGHMCSPGFNEAGARTPRKVSAGVPYYVVPVKLQ